MSRKFRTELLPEPCNTGALHSLAWLSASSSPWLSWAAASSEAKASSASAGSAAGAFCWRLGGAVGCCLRVCLLYLHKPVLSQYV